MTTAPMPPMPPRPTLPPEVALAETRDDPAEASGGVSPQVWLEQVCRETLWARDLADTAPGGRTAVRRCDLDHLVAFDDGGPTNTADLQPVGRTSHGH